MRDGKTPVLERDDAKRLFASLESENDILLLRDKAIFSMMLFGFVRVGAVVKMRVCDFEDGASPCLVLHEKGGRERRIPAHHLVTEAVLAENLIHTEMMLGQLRGRHETEFYAP